MLGSKTPVLLRPSLLYPSPMKSSLHIPVIAGRAHLGCTEKERLRSQKVEVELHIKFQKMPPACETDTLDSTPCYKEMSDALLKVFKKKPYATIEHLCLHCFHDIEKYLKKFLWLK
jgi:FolB domain-containing protein